MHYPLMKKFALIVFILFLPIASACKDIIVTNDATAGDYSLFMKVRDPSRPGLQILCMIEKGYEYTYHHPWKGYNIPYIVKHKLIGVATQGDTPPSVLKAGMLLSDAGIAYGDADCPTFYINPTKNAWDDFDWLRYAAQNASSEEEAVEKLEEVVKMHAPGIGENLFVVGKNKAYVIEADAFHFVKDEVDGITVMSNYPKQLWHSRLLKRIAFASDFDRVYEGDVRKWQTIRLGGFYGVKITKVGNDFIEAKQIPAGEKIEIDRGKGGKVGNFYIELEDCNGKTARVKMCYEYYAWEKKIEDMLNEKYGRITVMDLMNISRLHSEDLDGLRGICEGEKKAAMIFKIPENEKLAMGWFAPDQCVSIFVPVHICDKDIYEAYKNGEAAQLALNLLMQFGHSKVNFRNVERVFIRENEKMEEIALKRIDKAGEIMTVVDTEMQKQAILMQKLWMNIGNEEKSIIREMWNESYYITLKNIEKNIKRLSDDSAEVMASIALSIAKIRVDVESCVNGSNLHEKYNTARNYIERGEYNNGLKVIKEIFEKTDESLFGIEHKKEGGMNERAILISSLIVFIAIIVVLLRKPRK